MFIQYVTLKSIIYSYTSCCDGCSAVARSSICGEDRECLEYLRGIFLPFAARKGLKLARGNGVQSGKRQQGTQHRVCFESDLVPKCVEQTKCILKLG